MIRDILGGAIQARCWWIQQDRRQPWKSLVRCDVRDLIYQRVWVTALAPMFETVRERVASCP